MLLVLGVACQAPPPVHDPTPILQSVGAPRSSIDTADLHAALPERAEELLEGRFPGVIVARVPSGAISVRIRGTSSVIGNREPLYVIDGMPIEPGPGGALVGINPGDIARITVLKDVGSTAFYGVRGANGVVLITTKRN